MVFDFIREYDAALHDSLCELENQCGIHSKMVFVAMRSTVEYILKKHYTRYYATTQSLTLREMLSSQSFLEKFQRDVKFSDFQILDDICRKRGNNAAHVGTGLDCYTKEDIEKGLRCVYKLVAQYYLYDTGNHVPMSAYEAFVDFLKKYKSGTLNTPDSYMSGKKSVAKSRFDSDIYIPCGFGNQNHGFFIKGITKHANINLGEDESLFALVYNYLQKNSLLSEIFDISIFIKEKYDNGDLTTETDCNRVLQLMFVILLMVRYGYIESGRFLSFDCELKQAETELAFYCVNQYLKLFADIAGRTTAPKLYYTKGKGVSVFFEKELISQECISVCSTQGIGQQKRMWFAPNIVYHIGEAKRPLLEKLLSDISPYKTFRPGQFETLCHMMNSRHNTMCIMPTGSGKSLIYYLCALLQPNITVVISPSELLIADQMDNLKRTHRIDDVMFLLGDVNADQIQYKMLFLTPDTMQNSELLKTLTYLCYSKKVSQIVLDEVHCLSNLSHDFRPEYLMLSKYLTGFLDRACYRGFTATADTAVAKDLETQLDIQDCDIISPIGENRNNIEYSFFPCLSDHEMVDVLYNSIQSLNDKGRRVLVFTKSIKITKRIAEALQKDKKVYLPFYTGDSDSMKGFIEGKDKVLIASDEVGIGINFPNVDDIIHFGLPVSFLDYIQQSGRVGRNGNASLSTVIFLEKNRSSFKKLFDRAITIDHIIQTSIENATASDDYLEVYRKMFGTLLKRELFLQQVMDTYEEISVLHDYNTKKYPANCDFELLKKCYYALYVVGIVSDWYLGENNTVNFTVAESDFRSKKRRLTEYVRTVGNHQKTLYELSEINKDTQLLDAYVNWYYEYYLYYHREQFFYFQSFIEDVRYHKNISTVLSAHDSLNIDEINKIRNEALRRSYKEIIPWVKEKIKEAEAVDLERANQFEYHVKLDWALFCVNLIFFSRYDSDRLDRVSSKISSTDSLSWISSCVDIYQYTEIQNQYALFEKMCEIGATYAISRTEIFTQLFAVNKKDMVYYKEMIDYLRGRKVCL